MKLTFFLFLISFNSFAEDPNCDNPTAEPISALTNLQVPNCLKAEEVTRELQISSTAEMRRQANLLVPSSTGDFCNTCATNFLARASEDLEKKDKQNAFFQTAYKELEKSLSSISFSIASLGNTWNMGTNFSNSVTACKSDNIEKALKDCRSPFLRQFQKENLTGRIAGEIASLITTGGNGLPGVLLRPDSVRSCPIPDILVSNLRQYLFEEALTPEMIRKIALVDAPTPAAYQSRLSSTIGAANFRLLLDHPILKNMVQNPALLKTTFSRISTSGSPEALRNSFRTSVHSQQTGEALDRANAERCTSTIRSFTESLCSDNFKNGNLSLGPFHNYKKFMDEKPFPVSTSTSSVNENQIQNNLVAVQFCEASSPNKTSLGEVLSSMNQGMPQDERQKSLSSYSADGYSGTFGELKNAMCGYHPNTTCPDADGDSCKLYKKYLNRQASPEGRIAMSLDTNAKRALQNLIGTSGTVAGPTREVLVAEGILPQSNGQFAERPTPPERDSGYLAGVADGSITPNVTNRAQTQVAARTQNQQNTLQPQNAVFQPQAQRGSNSAVTPQLAGTEDDSEASRSVFNDLEQRRTRGQASTTTNSQTRSQAQPRRAINPESTNTPQTVATASPVSPIPGSAAGFVAPNFAPTNTTNARLDRDTTSQTKSQRDRNEALAKFEAAANNPAATGVAGDRGPASVGGAAGEQTVALTVAGDIRTNLERVLNGSDSSGADLRSKIRDQVPFRFQLNNKFYDVQFNNGACVVTSIDTDSRNADIARTIQNLFSSSIRSGRTTAGRSDTLQDLRQNLRQ